MYIIGDTHFGDRNIIGFEQRPFKSVQEMDSELIKLWNGEVPPTEEIIINGDMFNGSTIDEARKIIKELNGIKTLVAGNHDDDYLDVMYDSGITIYKYPIVIDDFWIVSHLPMYVTKSAPFVNVFAHVHNNPNYNKCSSRGFCTSIEKNNFRPIDFKVVKTSVLSIIESLG